MLGWEQVGESKAEIPPHLVVTGRPRCGYSSCAFFQENLEVLTSSLPFCNQQPFTEHHCVVETVLETFNSIPDSSNSSSRGPILSPFTDEKDEASRD